MIIIRDCFQILISSRRCLFRQTFSYEATRNATARRLVNDIRTSIGLGRKRLRRVDLFVIYLACLLESSVIDLFWIHEIATCLWLVTVNSLFNFNSEICFSSFHHNRYVRSATVRGHKVDARNPIYRVTVEKRNQTSTKTCLKTSCYSGWNRVWYSVGNHWRCFAYIRDRYHREYGRRDWSR